MVILGIDPGTAHTGYGVVLSHGTRLAALDGGVIETRAGVPLERRLADIHARVCDLIREHEPAALAVEDLYFGRNVHSAFAVGQARGVVLLSAGMAGIPCFSYTPQAVKQAVCGSGSAAKDQVQRMVGTLLSLPEPPRPDHAADALAVAICHATARPSRRRWHEVAPPPDEAPLRCRCAAAPRDAAGVRVIASVRGRVLSRLPGDVVIEAAGVGYRLAVSSETLSAVPSVGQEATLFTHLVLRDDGMHLYGFSSEAERELFLMLIGVQSVGPKVALAVLSGGAPRELLNAIASGDTARFQAVPGIGKRTAERIIVELREKVAGRATDDIVVRRTASDDPRTLAREGLLGLGFTPLEADKLLDQAAGETPEDLIAGALRAAR